MVTLAKEELEADKLPIFMALQTACEAFEEDLPEEFQARVRLLPRGEMRKGKGKGKKARNIREDSSDEELFFESQKQEDIPEYVLHELERRRKTKHPWPFQPNPLENPLFPVSGSLIL